MVYADIRGVPRIEGVKQGWGGESYFLALYLVISKMVRDMTKVTTNHQQEVAYALSIGTKVDDLG